MTDPEAIPQINLVRFEVHPVRIIQEASNMVANGTSGMQHNISVRVVQEVRGSPLEVYSKTVGEGPFYPFRLRRAVSKAHKLAGILAMGPGIQTQADSSQE